MEIWLKQGEEELRLPVLPTSYELNYSHNNTETNISNFGTINIIGKRNLATASLDTFFPKQKYGFVQYKNFPCPKDCIKLIKSWMNNPIRYIVTGSINLLMTIEEFSYSEQDSSGDVYFSLSLKEYRIPKVKETKNKKTTDKSSKKVTQKTTKRESKKVKSSTYIVKKGDTLSCIAKKMTGTASNWRAIYNQNKDLIGGNPNKIKVGQKLVIKI